MVKFTDTRDARRSFRIVDLTDRGCWAEATQTAYIVPGTVLRRREAGKGNERETSVGDLPSGENAITLKQGDLIVVTRDLAGSPARYDGQGRFLTPAEIGCTFPQVFAAVRPGEPIWFDDGKIGGCVEKVEETSRVWSGSRRRASGARSSGRQGHQSPGQRLTRRADGRDLEDLSFIAEHADIVELSFANTARGRGALQQHLASLGKRRPAWC